MKSAHAQRPYETRILYDFHARNLIKDYSSQKYGINGTETADITRLAEEVNIVIVRVLRAKLVLQLGGNPVGKEALGVLCAVRRADTSIDIKYLHVRRAMRGKSHATAMVNGLMKEFPRASLTVEQASCATSQALWDYWGFRTCSDSSFLRFSVNNDEDGSCAEVETPDQAPSNVSNGNELSESCPKSDASTHAVGKNDDTTVEEKGATSVKETKRPKKRQRVRTPKDAFGRVKEGIDGAWHEAGNLRPHLPEEEGDSSDAEVVD